jgi:hypothetical protein
MWRLISNPKLGNNKSDNYYLSLNKEYFNDCYMNPNYTVTWPYSFDIPFEFRSSNNTKVELLKLSGDSSVMISIHENKSLQYWSYTNLFFKNKVKTESKNCQQCNAKITQQSYSKCASCNKKLCLECKLEDIIPEISLKSKKPVCSDCLSMISSTNKMLYDF